MDLTLHNQFLPADPVAQFYAACANTEQFGCLTNPTGCQATQARDSVISKWPEYASSIFMCLLSELQLGHELDRKRGHILQCSAAGAG